ncbi:MAG: hypothetical protein K6F46_04685 [Desulfovibrio sp.]|nr:hypothetical protein [Desulfovibrio sp.]
MNVFSQKTSPLQCRDTALALVFLLLIVWLFTKNAAWAYAGMGLCLLAMLWPSSMKPLAKCWFGLSLMLGAVMSRVLLTLIYLLLVLPVALFRRLIGKDAMRLRQYGRRDDAVQTSAFVEREHTYCAEDLRRPY